MGTSGEQGVVEPFFVSGTQGRMIVESLIFPRPLFGDLEGGVKP